MAKPRLEKVRALFYVLQLSKEGASILIHPLYYYLRLRCGRNLLPPGLFVVGGDGVGHADGFGDVVADVVFADEVVDAGVFEGLAHVVAHTGEHHVDAFLL